VAPHPNYTFDPANFPESARAQEIGRKLILPPGPRNPVGVYWVSLSLPGYGIHGTPHPETIGNMESHGCFRLCNWDAQALGESLILGTPVYLDAPPRILR
jgi:lipoprotein-anchoring transpeptidase ErfK/SrfK